MAYRNIEDQRAAGREHYRNNKAAYKSRARVNNRRYRAKIRQWVEDYKAEIGCAHCPESDPICLDFHHTADDKEETVGRAVTMQWPRERILIEMQKCIILCSNCHRKEHRRLRAE